MRLNNAVLWFPETMSRSWREFQSYIYLALLASCVVILVMTINDLLVSNSALKNSGFTLTAAGAWETWIFAFALVFSIIFAYYFAKIVRETKKFHSLIASSSKHNFVKNLKDLQKIARNLGPRYEQILKESMDKWKVK